MPKCLNCGSKLVYNGSNYKCPFCNAEFSRRDIEFQEIKDKEYLAKRLSRNEELFHKMITNSEKPETSIKEVMSYIDEALKANQDSIAEQLEKIVDDKIEKLPLEKEPSKVKNLSNDLMSSISAIEENGPFEDGSYSIDDFKTIAFEIRRKVEDSLISKFNVRHEGAHFVCSRQELLDAKEKYKDLISPKGYQIVHIPDDPKVIKFINEDKTPDSNDTCETPPILRFLQAGLEPDDADKASYYWRTTNSFVHPGPECKQKAGKLCSNNKVVSVFKDMYNFFVEHGFIIEER